MKSTAAPPQQRTLGQNWINIKLPGSTWADLVPFDPESGCSFNTSAMEYSIYYIFSLFKVCLEPATTVVQCALIAVCVDWPHKAATDELGRLCDNNLHNCTQLHTIASLLLTGRENHTRRQTGNRSGRGFRSVGAAASLGHCGQKADAGTRQYRVRLNPASLPTLSQVPTYRP